MLPESVVLQNTTNNITNLLSSRRKSGLSLKHVSYQSGVAAFSGYFFFLFGRI